MDAGPRGRPSRSWRRFALAAIALLVVPYVAYAGWSKLHTGPASQPALAATVAASSPSSSASPGPTIVPSPTDLPTAAPVADSAPPPPREPSEPAHPQAPPPPTQAAAPAASTIPVPVYRQAYSLSCEESSLSMVLAFYGRSVSDQDVLTVIGTDLVHPFAGPGGGDPYVDFVGDPNGSEVRNTGYGVYWPPIASAAAHYGVPAARAGHGVSPGTVYDAVRSGHPVIVWVTFDLRAHARADYQAYDGRMVPYAGPWEHAMVVSGVSDGGVRLNDPDRGQYWVGKAQFETAYAVYDLMAVVFGAGPTAPTPTPTASPTPTAPSPTPTPAPTPTPSPTPAPTPTPTPTPTSTPVAAPTPSPSPTATPSPSPT